MSDSDSGWDSSFLEIAGLDPAFGRKLQRAHLEAKLNRPELRTIAPLQEEYRLRLAALAKLPPQASPLEYGRVDWTDVANAVMTPVEAAILSGGPPNESEIGVYADLLEAVPGHLNADATTALERESRFRRPPTLAMTFATQRDRLPAATQTAVEAWARANPGLVANTYLGYLTLPAERTRYDRNLPPNDLVRGVWTPRWWLTLAGMWSRLEPRHREGLVRAALRTEDGEAANLAIRALRFAPNEPRLRARVGELARMAGHPARTDALLTLAAIGDPEWRAFVARHAQSANPVDRMDATAAVAYPELHAITAPLATDPSPTVRHALRAAMGDRNRRFGVPLPPQPDHVWLLPLDAERRQGK